VFLVPVTPDRYELYCEEHDAPAAGDEPPKGFKRRMVHRFNEQLRAAEHEGRRVPPPDEPRPTLFARVKARSMRWIAESIAEQRLLWQLRGRSEARLAHPDDLTDAQATQLLRRSLTRDWERHRFWLIVDTLGGLLSLLLILLPGPNVIGYYFIFRIVGHYLSLRGARQGLTRVAWAMDPSAPLTQLRAVVGEAPDAREELVRDVEHTLRLERLTTFFQRAATG